MVSRWLLAPLALVWGLGAGTGGASPQGTLYTPFKDPPGHLTDAAFSPAGDSLYLVDLRGASISVHDLQGGRLHAVKRPGLGDLEFNRPLRLSPRQGGYLLDDGGLHLLWLDASLKPQRGWILPSRSAPPDARKVVSDRGPLQEIAMWQSAPAGAQAAVVTGDYLDAKGWRNGAALLESGDSLRLKLLAERPVDNPNYLYELNLVPNLASVGGAVYELRFAGSPTVERLLPSPRQIPLPKPFDKPLAPLGKMGGAENALRLFARLRSQALPVAIHGWADDLYLMTWTPQAGGALRWDLWRWAEKEWRGPWPVPAPPAARDVRAVPGPVHWAFLYKAAPRSPESQNLLGFRLVSSSEIERRLR